MRILHPNLLAPSSRTKAVRRVPLPPGALPGAVIVFLLAGLGPNVVLAAAALIVLLVGLALLWRPGETPVLLFLFAFPWLQASVSIFHANWLGVPVAEHSPFPADMQAAILLTLAGLLTVAVGMRLGAGAWRSQDAAAAIVIDQSVDLGLDHDVDFVIEHPRSQNVDAGEQDRDARSKNCHEQCGQTRRG